MNRSVLTLLWMSGTWASFCLMAVAIRELDNRIPVAQALLFRSIIGLLFVACIIRLTNKSFLFKTSRPVLHSVRNTFHFAGQYGWFLGLGLLPLAEVFALEFTVPIWTIIIAAIFLGESITWRKVAAVLLGLVGVLIIVRPGIEIVDTAALIVLASAVCYSVSHSCTKVMALSEKPLTILFYMCLVQLPIGLLLSLFAWVWPAGIEWLWIIIIGLTALSAHFCLSKAMQFSDVGIVVTLDFIRLPMIGLVGVLLYQESLELALLLGGGLMLVGNMLNIKRSGSRKETP
jgi:drug/metabolite transporter (DMT)-like permease